MNPIHPPSGLKQLIQSEEAEWKAFFKSLREIPATEVDLMVLPVAEEVTKKTDCRTCANCCTILDAGLSEEEIQTMAGLQQREVQEFTENETATEPGTNIVFLKRKPCIFLNGCDCSIYPHRPEGCVDFPGFGRKQIKFRLRRFIEHMEICPIIYNTFNILRQQAAR